MVPVPDCRSKSAFNLPLPSIPPYPNMKLAFVFAVLASMAVLSLAAPPLDGDEAMLQALEATLGAETHGSASADSDVADLETNSPSSPLSPVDVQTKSTPSGKYDEHIAPVLDHLAALRAKLAASVKSSSVDIETKTTVSIKMQKAAEEVPLLFFFVAILSWCQFPLVALTSSQAAGALKDAKTLDAQVAGKANKEIEL